MRRVLVIDDHEPSRENVVSVLAESGFQVAGEGSSGAGALVFWALQPWAWTAQALSIWGVMGLSALAAWTPSPLPLPQRGEGFREGTT